MSSWSVIQLNVRFNNFHAFKAGSYLFAGPPQLAPYLPLVHDTLSTALRPSTVAAYKSKFRIFLEFCVYVNYFKYDDVNLILAFLQFLLFNQISKAVMQNYLSAIRHNLVLHNLRFIAPSEPKVGLFLRSVSINRPYQPKFQGVIDIAMLIQIIDSCDILRYTKLYRSIFLTAFFGFLRISNLAPNSTGTFDHTRHLARGDLIFAPPGAHLIIKWSKVMQYRNSHQVIQIPLLNMTKICPVTALTEMMCANRGGNSNTPLFNIPYTVTAVTQGQIRSALGLIHNHLQLPLNFLTFHAFRRSGVTLAFNNDVSLQNLKVHGDQMPYGLISNKHKPPGSSPGPFRLPYKFLKFLTQTFKFYLLFGLVLLKLQILNILNYNILV